MKIKVLTRSVDEVTRDTRRDLRKVHRNPDPKLHPFERAKEYKRAVTAAKLERMFAKPFLFALSGHTDGVYSSATSPTSLVAFLSGSGDGEVRVWDIAHRSCLWSVFAHDGIVNGLAVTGDGSRFLSCGVDKTVKCWPLTPALTGEFRTRGADDAGAAAGGAATAAAAAAAGDVEPLAVWTGRYPFTGLDHCRERDQFATSGDGVHLWDHARQTPVHHLRWGDDTVHAVRYNPAEQHLLASCAADRSVVLYDSRASGASALRKLTMRMAGNALDWNPREPINFTVASEDHNLYTFDMRNLRTALCVHSDHVGAVIDVRYSPTGKEFVSGSYDRTVRIFGNTAGRSRDAYHTKRMQRIFCVHYSADAHYVLSGSDDTNVRVWKADASRPLRKELPRERAKREYREALKKRYAHLPEVRKILKSRHVPSVIRSTQKRERESEAAAQRRTENRRRHSKPGAVPYEAVRKRVFVDEQE